MQDLHRKTDRIGHGCTKDCCYHLNTGPDANRSRCFFRVVFLTIMAKLALKLGCRFTCGKRWL